MAANFPLSLIIRAVDQVTAPIRRINARIAAITSPLRRVSNAFVALWREAGVPRIVEGVANIGRAAGRVGSELFALGRRFVLFGGIAAGAIFGLTRSFAGAGKEITDASERLGVGVEWLQEMRWAAERSGINVQTFDMAIQRAGRRIGEFAATGRGEAAPVLRAMGIQVKDAAGNMRTFEDILPEVADKLAAIRSPMVRNAVAMKLFDSEGVRMVQLLEQGAAGMAALRARARELGVVMDKEALAAAGRFDDAMVDLRGALLGLRNIIGAELVPVMLDLVRTLTELIVENGPQIRAWAREFARELPGRLRDLLAGFRAMVAVLGPIVSGMATVIDALGGFRVVATAVAVLLAGKLLLAVGALTLAVRGFGVALLATPVGWILLGLAAIAGAALLIVKKWEPIKAFFADLWGSVLRVTETVVEKIKGLVPDWVRSLFGGGGAGVRIQADARPMIDARSALRPGGLQVQRSEASVTVNFENVPRGVRVSQDPRSTAPLDLSLGYTMQEAMP